MKSLDNGFDYLAFIEEGYEQQTKYDKKAGFKYTAEELKRIDHLVAVGGEETFGVFQTAMDFRYQLIVNYMGHMIEEIHEARAYVPRRSWKNDQVSFLDDQEKRGEFVAELFDILLFHRAVLAYAGVTPEEFLEASRAKMNYNGKRKDHNVNGTESAQRDVKAELQGECPSSAALRQYNATGPQHSAGAN